MTLPIPILLCIFHESFHRLRVILKRVVIDNTTVVGFTRRSLGTKDRKCNLNQIQYSVFTTLPQYFFSEAESGTRESK